MKILLLSPPYLPEYMRNARCDFVSLSKTQWYPIWLGYCGAFLEKQRHAVKLIDAPAYGYNHTQTKKLIIEYRPELLVVYSGMRSEDNDIRFAEEIIDALNCRTIFVGPYASINPENILKKSKKVSLVIKGEFEYPVLELAEGKNYKNIKNLHYKNNGKIITNEQRPLLNTEQLDAIPFVTEFFKKHLNFKYYKAPSEYRPFIDLMTGRGCAWGICTFCLWVHSFITGSVYNKRSIENVVEEFKFVKEKIPEVRSIMVQDDTLPEERAGELSEALLSAEGKISWSCYARAQLSYETLKLMKKAGCRNLHVGYESANPRVLKNIKKGLTVEGMSKFTEDAKKAGLHIHADFAIGFDGETIKGIRETIKWAKKLDPDTAQFQLMIPYPCTPFYERLNKEQWLNEKNEPDYPNLSNREMRKLAKKAYREFYFSRRYMKRAIRNPYEHFLGRLDTLSRAIPAMFWKRWS